MERHLSPQHIIPRSRSEEQEERRQRGRRPELHTPMSPDRSLSGSGYRTQNTKIKDMISVFGTLQPASVDVLRWAGRGGMTASSWERGKGERAPEEVKLVIAFRMSGGFPSSWKGGGGEQGELYQMQMRKEAE